MKLKTLEKLFDYIHYRDQYPHEHVRAQEIRNELRALVKAESEPAGVQAEGRGEFVRLPSGVQLQAVTQAEFETAQRIMARWMIEHPQIERLILVRDVPSLGHKPHNPDNLPSPGEGYRFLDEDEIQDGPILREIGIWALSALEWLDGNSGWDKSRTYRTSLTRERLAQKRKEAGK